MAAKMHKKGQGTAVKILIVNRFFGGAQIPTGRMASGSAAVKGKKCEGGCAKVG